MRYNTASPCRRFLPGSSHVHIPQAIPGLLPSAHPTRTPRPVRQVLGSSPVHARFRDRVTVSILNQVAVAQGRQDVGLDQTGLAHEENAEQVELFSAGMLPGTDAQLALFDDIDVRADLARIAVPVLVVSPLGDLLITPVHSLELAEGIPGARLATLDCGHAIAAERPAEWAELITKFLAAVDG